MRIRGQLSSRYTVEESSRFGQAGTRLVRIGLAFMLLVAVAVGGVNYGDLAGDGASAFAGYQCVPTDPGAYRVIVYEDDGTISHSEWWCPYSVDTGGTFESGAEVAIDGADRILVAANDSDSDERVVARFSADGSVDSSWGASGVARVPLSTIPRSSSWHEQLDIVAAADGTAFVWTGDVAYRLDSNGTPGWEVAIPRCDFVGLPALSLSPDESVLWTGGFDDGGCTSGYVSQIDAATGTVLTEGWMDPYAMGIRSLNTTSAWVFDTRVAAVISIGDNAGDQWQPTRHEILVDASFTYPVPLSYDQFLPYPNAAYSGGQVLVTGAVEVNTPPYIPDQVAVMMVGDTGMNTSFDGDGAVVIDTTDTVVGVGSNSAGTVYVALSDGTASEILAFLPNGNPDTSFDVRGAVMEALHPIDEMIIEDDVAVMAWVDNSRLTMDMLELGPPAPSVTFDDVSADSTFFGDIEWLAGEGITRGCNPPTNDQFCPNASVSRGQMAAFLHRALGDTIPPTRGPIDFTDDDGSTFEADIEWLSATGITAGCNPPANDRFCPNQPVTRGQMAAFLVRALGYTDDGGGDLFTDDNTSIFETQIDRLATAGVTRGCNPPMNDRFCPNSNVTRAQMAAFLHRALG